MKTCEQRKLCVVICTYNRADLLRDCLASLRNQIIPLLDFDILVVDNNSTDHTKHVTSSLAREMPNLAVVFEPQQGLSFARNRGLAEATTEWVAYLDDDARARPRWVEQIFHIIETQRFDAFGGPYIPWYREGKVDWYLDEYGTNKAWMPYRTVTRLDTACFSGGNAVYRREAALDAGGFPTGLGMRGSDLGYGEENVLQRRMRKRGHMIGYDPLLIIEHLVPLRKQQLAWFCERNITQGRSYFLEHRSPASLTGRLKLLLGFIAVDIRNLTRATWRLARGTYRLQNFYIDTVPPLLFQREILRGLFTNRKTDGYCTTASKTCR